MIPLPPWVYAAAAGALVLGSFGAGWKVRGWRCDAATAQALAQAAKERDRLTAQANTASAQYEATRAALGEIAPIEREKVRVIYADRQVPADCALPADARSLLDAARNRSNAATAGQPVVPLPTDPTAARSDD